MDEEQHLIDFVEHMIKDLEKVRENPKEEIQGAYFNLYIIGDIMQVYGLGAERRQHRQLERENRMSY